MALTDKLTAIADGFRSSRGTVEKLSLGEMAALAAVPIQSGGSDGDGSPRVIGQAIHLVVDAGTTARTYPQSHLYNGVRLPELPFEALASYPYAWIRDNGSTGYYDLLMATGVWYCSATDTLSHNDSNNVQWYQIEKATAASATAWTFSQSYASATWGDDANRVCLWSNHDIRNGSAMATDIYFEGTEPVPAA